MSIRDAFPKPLPPPNPRELNIRCPQSARDFLVKMGLKHVARGTAAHPVTGQICSRVWVTQEGPWAPGSGRTLVQAARSFQRHVCNPLGLTLP